MRTKTQNRTKLLKTLHIAKFELSAVNNISSNLPVNLWAQATFAKSELIKQTLAAIQLPVDSYIDLHTIHSMHIWPRHTFQLDNDHKVISDHICLVRNEHYINRLRFTHPCCC